MAESPAASVPSLAAISTDGEDSLQLMGELPANASSKSFSVAVDLEATSWHAILDEDDETRASQCTSGILSVEESLSRDFAEAEVASEHSLSSAKTLKSPSGRINDDARSVIDSLYRKVEFERVESEVPVQRACHGALNINPKQLAGVFAMFAADRKPKDEEGVHDNTKAEEATATVVSTEPATEPEPTFVPAIQEDSPFSVQERFKSRSRTAHPTLTAELYWKPRAKSLEKECETLKEILADDSSKILQLKSALETQRSDKMRTLEEMKTFQEQLESTQRELETLKKEREAMLENETDYRETIRILKHEVDIITRERSNTKNTVVDREELQQIRLENQLFAAQIVDYEAELECLEQQVKTSPPKDTRKKEVQRAVDPPEGSAVAERPMMEAVAERPMLHTMADIIGTCGAAGAKEDGNSIFRATPNAPEQENQESSPQEPESVKGIVSKLPYVENVTSSMEEEGIESISDTTPVRCKRGKMVRIAIEKVEENGSNEEGKPALDDQGSDQGDCMENFASGMPTTQFPQQLLGNVLGMFTVGGKDEGTDKDEVFVIHEAARTSPIKGAFAVQEAPQTSPATGIHCLQWRSPDQLPTVVKVENIVPLLEMEEDRNPPSTSSSGCPLSDKTNTPTPSVRNLMALREHEEKSCGGREDTAIEVLQNVDASQSIEVRLTRPDPNKETESSKTYKEKCDVWCALSNCPFSSDAQ